MIKSDGAYLIQVVWDNIGGMAPEKRTIRQPVAGLIILLGVILLTGSLFFSYINRSSATSEAVKLPRSIAGFTLTTASYGPEAVAEITRLHGKEFSIDTGAMGTYGEDHQISLWIANFSTPTIAKQMLNTMYGKIQQGNSPFTPTNQKDIGGRTIYYLDGMGQKHAYFQSESRVLWLAAYPSIANQAMQQILEVYP